MATCPSCSNETPAGARWCGICHANVLQPEVGRLASPGKRLIAYFLDGLVPLVAIFLIVIVGIGTFASTEGGNPMGLLLGFGLLIAYVVWAFRLFARGTTPGKHLLGMFVIKEDGERVGLATMILREWIGKAISGMVFSLGFLWILIDRDNQGWHDKLASTYVVG